MGWRPSRNTLLAANDHKKCRNKNNSKCARAYVRVSVYARYRVFGVRLGGLWRYSGSCLPMDVFKGVRGCSEVFRGRSEVFSGVSWMFGGVCGVCAQFSQVFGKGLEVFRECCSCINVQHGGQQPFPVLPRPPFTCSR